MAVKRQPEEMATLDELVAALASLTPAERSRLYRTGNRLALGSEFASGKELLAETARRALIGTSGDRHEGERGRPWPRSVHIVAFLMECMKSIANGSHNSLRQAVDRQAEALVTDEGETNPNLHEAGQHHPSVEEQLIERQEEEARQAAAEAEVAAIRKLFAHGDVVHDILDGEEMGMSADEIREMTGLTPTQYASARKRLRRTVDKYISGRRHK